MIKITGKLKRDGAAIEVRAADSQAVGTRVEFNGREYVVKSHGNLYSTASGMKRYLYVDAVPPAAADGSPKLYVKEVACPKGREIELIRMPYCEPSSIRIEIKPRLKRVVITKRSIWFSGMRGYGGQSKGVGSVAFTSTADPIYVAAAAFIAGDSMALLALADAIEESGDKGPKAALRRFYELAQQENPEAYLAKIRRDKAYADCRFKVGDMVFLTHSYSAEPKPVVAVYWCEQSVEWRVGVVGMDAPQSRFYLAPSAVGAAS